MLKTGRLTQTYERGDVSRNLLGAGTCEPESCRHSHQVSDRARLHLPHHFPSVLLYCDLADAEFSTDLLIQPAVRYQGHDLPLSNCERGVAIPELPYLRSLAECNMTAPDGLADRAQQDIAPEWFHQELDSSGLHRPHGHRDVTMTRDEDDRHLDPIDDALLHIETIEVGKRNVEYQAAWAKDAWPGEEFLGGREGLRLPACTTNQRVQRFAHRVVVVDNEDDWYGAR
jgi:hypothetical protein